MRQQFNCWRNERDATIRGEFPAFALDRKPNRFKLQRGVDAERIVILK